MWIHTPQHPGVVCLGVADYFSPRHVWDSSWRHVLTMCHNTLCCYTKQTGSLGLIVFHAGFVWPLCDPASWPFLSSGLPSGLCRPIFLLQLCTPGLEKAAAVPLGSFTALPEGTRIFTPVSMVCRCLVAVWIISVMCHCFTLMAWKRGLFWCVITGE